MRIYIKNMVCTRCKIVVKSELEKMGYHYTSVRLGEVELAEQLTDEQLIKLDCKLREIDLELMNDKKNQLVEKIILTINEIISASDIEIKTKFSNYLCSKLNNSYTYSYLSGLFSEVQDTTIEKFFINQKIEKVKELLLYDEMTISEIAFRLKYSSVAHLSNQFKKITGYSPSQFIQLRYETRHTA